MHHHGRNVDNGSHIGRETGLNAVSGADPVGYGSEPGTVERVNLKHLAPSLDCHGQKKPPSGIDLTP